MCLVSNDLLRAGPQQVVAHSRDQRRAERQHDGRGGPLQGGLPRGRRYTRVASRLLQQLIRQHTRQRTGTRIPARPRRRQGRQQGGTPSGYAASFGKLDPVRVIVLLGFVFAEIILNNSRFLNIGPNSRIQIFIFPTLGPFLILN
jgi:hypothetical protein